MELTTSWKEEGIQEGLQRGFSQGMQQGIQQGIHQGLEQGIQQGEYRALIRLLTRRFQTLPADVLARIEAAQPEQLEQWLDNTLDATTLDDVFRNH